LIELKPERFISVYAWSPRRAKFASLGNARSAASKAPHRGLADCSLLAAAVCYKQTMIRKVLAGLALMLGLSSTALTAEPCKDCSSASVQSARERIRDERAQDAKRISEEPAGRPWDGSRPGARPAEPVVTK
jgi:hypothetical protein